MRISKKVSGRSGAFLGNLLSPLSLKEEIKMSESDIAKEQILREVYFSPITGYGSREQLYKDVKARGVRISRREVKDWLEHQSVHARFKTPVRKFGRRQTYSPGIGLFAQIDLVDMSSFEDENDGYRWILTTVDVFSRYTICVPIRRKFSKFTRSAVKTFLEEYVNRFNKSLMGIMWKYFEKVGNHEWIEVLRDLVANINSKINRSIGMPPDKVTEENSYEVFMRLYGKALPFKEPKYEVGDRVRLSEYASPILNPNKKTFKKGYLASFTKQIFIVVSVSHGSPPMYHLKFAEGEREGDMLKGSFYQQEMTQA